MAQKVIWAYCRVSTAKAEQELSLEQQRDWAQTIAQLRGCKLVIFSEKASAKTIENRPECVRMLELLKNTTSAGRPIALVATSFDRLSRDITDTMILGRALRQAGVELYVRDRGTVQMTSFADQAALAAQAMGGHAENDAKSNRAKASWDRRRREGKPTSNKAPYGIQLRSERDTAAPDTSVWVLRAFEWYAAGVGMHTIALRLQANAPSHRVLTSKVGSDGEIIVRERATVWESNRVRKMFAQRRYRDVVVPAPIFDAVTERLEHVPRWPQRRVYEYPLSGAIKCFQCKRVFHGHATGASGSKRMADGSTKRYKRTSRVRYYGCTVCHYMINADRLEEWFRAEVAVLKAHPALYRKWVGSPGIDMSARELNAEVRRLKNSLEQLAQKRQRAWDLALTGHSLVVADLPEQLRLLNESECKLRDDLYAAEAALQGRETNKKTQAQVRALLEEFWVIYDKAAYEDKRSLCNELVATLGGAEASKAGLTWLKAPIIGIV